MYTNSVRSTISIFAVKKKLQLTTQRECNLQRQLLGFREGIFHSSALQPRKPRYRSMTIVSVATRRIYPYWWCATLPGDEVKWHLLAKICSKKCGGSQLHHTFILRLQPQWNVFILSIILHLLNSGSYKYGAEQSFSRAHSKTKRGDRPGCAIDYCSGEDTRVFAVAEERGGINVSCRGRENHKVVPPRIWCALYFVEEKYIGLCIVLHEGARAFSNGAFRLYWRHVIILRISVYSCCFCYIRCTSLFISVNCVADQPLWGAFELPYNRWQSRQVLREQSHWEPFRFSRTWQSRHHRKYVTMQVTLLTNWKRPCRCHVYA